MDIRDLTKRFLGIDELIERIAALEFKTSPQAIPEVKPRTHNEAHQLKKERSKSDKLKDSLLEMLEDPETTVFWATLRRHLEPYNDDHITIKYFPSGSFRITLEIANPAYKDRWPGLQERNLTDE